MVHREIVQKMRKFGQFIYANPCIFTALHALHVLGFAMEVLGMAVLYNARPYSYEKAVCRSVCLLNAWIMTK